MSSRLRRSPSGERFVYGGSLSSLRPITRIHQSSSKTFQKNRMKANIAWTQKRKCPSSAVSAPPKSFSRRVLPAQRNFSGNALNAARRAVRVFWMRSHPFHRPFGTRVPAVESSDTDLGGHGIAGLTVARSDVLECSISIFPGFPCVMKYPGHTRKRVPREKHDHISRGVISQSQYRGLRKTRVIRGTFLR